jgi:hypothetical protein
MSLGQAVRRFVQNPKVMKVLLVVVVEVAGVLGRMMTKRRR